MLARIEAIDGVVAAEVDHAGEFLRLSLSSGDALDLAMRTLRESGYAADTLATKHHAERWYGRADVRELSREEAHVVAQRVVTRFARERSIESSVAASLETATARGLYAYFEANPIADPTAVPGARDREISIAVEMATRDVIGDAVARSLAAALCADLDVRRSSEAEPDR